MSFLVIYKSVSGFTKNYAEMIAEELDSDCIEISEFSETNIKNYDLFIFGGSLHAIGINGLKMFREFIPIIGFGKIVIFAVGASPSKEGIVKIIKKENLKSSEESKIPLFYLRGGFDFSKLDFKNKIIMRLFQWKMILNRNRTNEENGMLAAYKNPLDVTEKEKITDIIEHIKSMSV